MSIADKKFDVLDARPPQLFFGGKERDFVKQISDEITERIIGQQIAYYPIDLERTNFHPLYGEAIIKTFLSPIHVYCLVEWEDMPTSTTHFGTEQMSKLIIHFHKRRLTEDQNLFVRPGDFVAYGKNFYEILSTFEPKQIFGQIDHKIEISANAIKARDGQFNSL